MWCTGLGHFNDYYNMLFPKVNKIIVNTSLSKYYVAHSYITVVCVIG